MYCVVWQYEVRADQQDLFEYTYGPKGAWSQLFSTSKQYEVSQLSKCLDRENEYLLLDWWKDATSYQAFLKDNESTYASLSSQFENLYVKEVRLGAFESIKL